MNYLYPCGAGRRDREEPIHYSLLPLTLKHGGVPVSTGVWRQDKRAVAPDHHKTGTLKLTDNTKTVAVAA